MNKYLIELLKLQSSVILPGFGSLMIGNSKTGKIVFNPHLKFNDGALAKFIASREGTDLLAAQNQVAKFVREIQAELAKGNSFDIFQFGKFQKNKEGVEEFIQDGTPIKIEDLVKPTDKKAIAATDKKVESVKPADAEKPKVEEKKTQPEKSKTEEKPVEKKTEAIKPDEVEKPKEDLAAKLTSSEKKVEDKITAEIKKEIPQIQEDKKAEEILQKQAKNTFTPSSEVTSEKEIETKTDQVKPVEISKSIPLAEASKKDPAAQEKNTFKPIVEKVEDLKAAIHEDKNQTENKLAAAAETVKSSVDKPAEDAKKSGTEKPTKHKKEEEKPKKESVKEKFKKDKPQKVKHEDPERKKPKKKKRGLVWFILIILIGGGAAAGWFYKDEINSFLHQGVSEHDSDSTHTEPHDHDTTVTQPEHHETEPEVDTSLTETPVETETAVETETQVTETAHTNHTSPGGSYHIIGNAFSSETNAENYVKKMQDKGYSGAQNIGKYNGLYLVSLKSFGSKEEAKNNLSTVKADADGAYVFTSK